MRWVAGLLGFSAGLPLALTAGTMQAWMVARGVSLETIGLASLLTVPYALKFVWAPALDRYVVLGAGRRRGWMLLSQAGLCAAISAMALADPVRGPAAFGALALTVAFLSATQDIAVDAYLVESFDERQRGWGVGIYMTGYRVGMLVSGALALVFADAMSWKAVYLLMGALSAVGVAGTLLASEPPAAGAVVEPLSEFFGRREALTILGFVILFRLGEKLAHGMTAPFLLELGHSLTEVGVVGKAAGIATTMVGALAGGALVSGAGMRRALLVGGVLLAVPPFVYAGMAVSGGALGWLLAATVADNLVSGLASAAITAYTMSVCDRRFSATQFALLTSASALPKLVLRAGGGYAAVALGWPMFFGACAGLAIPGLVLWNGLARRNK
jgi:PAT family beta-lactamase induction signal transducer AmpG